MSKKEKPKAPRFHSSFERRENRNILVMDRKILEDNVNVAIGSEISLSASQFHLFPTEPVEGNAKVLAATLGRREHEYRLTIYRYDPKDPEDERINTDVYTVWTGLPKHLPRDEMIKRGSTDYDANFRDYEENYMFIKIEKHDKGHHLQELPKHVIPFCQ